MVARAVARRKRTAGGVKITSGTLRAHDWLKDAWRYAGEDAADDTAKEGWADMGMLTDCRSTRPRSRLTIRSNAKLRAVVEALRVEASGGTGIVGWSRRRLGRFGGVRTPL